MMQIKFNLNNFIFYGARLSQLDIMPAAYAVVAGGCDWPIQWRHFVTFLTLRALRWMVTPLTSSRRLRRRPTPRWSDASAR